MINAQNKTFTSPLNKLLWVMQCLRDKDHGCPWDLEQDFKSILPYTLEEAYEVADAIERGHMDDLREELGDLLLQVVYHTQMAAEASEFTFDEVALGVADKMISRHPHVFGNKDAANSSAVDAIWDQQKERENAQKSQKGAHTLDSVTLGLPALLRAQKLQKKASKTGFEWPNPNAAFDKLTEEIIEFKEALASDNKTHQEEELGDMLFCIVNFARMKGLNAEEALRKANNKFVKRFSGLEDDFREKQTPINQASLNEMLDVWNEQKKKG
ncbi:MAG: nucleoside triphosphate pyrophosphohydrolase [Alphaproteobacteria bacterium]|nr:nucleoside triphosphate pyrophosphohydrolase [Alphaproteobacteria bacterium]NCQ88020.1 nucleoside triphosphate pyrophosphohydrolase [Alphaproteobacteria bacterium]NCT05473.1 nucleoside triphosphate pyrophosphohydrolase [Alphaproteobacteria bacterium]